MSDGLIVFGESNPHQADSLPEKGVRMCSLPTASQPGGPSATEGPDRILPFLYLGSQIDAQDCQSLRSRNIAYVLNVSATCPKAKSISETRFMRVPVEDSHTEDLVQYFDRTFTFLDKVRESSGCVLVHCSAGISRSPTVAIAYIMRHLRLSSNDAYRYVKSKRSRISPNFNFLGQLLKYEKMLQSVKILGNTPDIYSSEPALPSLPCWMSGFISRTRNIPFVSQKKRRLLKPTVTPDQFTLSLELPKRSLGVSETTKVGNLAGGVMSATTDFAGGRESSSATEAKRPFTGGRSLSLDFKWLALDQDENSAPPGSADSASDRPNMGASEGSSSTSPLVKRKDWKKLSRESLTLHLEAEDTSWPSWGMST
ncbi:dual specificity protein phosphatase 8-like [Galendromus occidentalis]|uniref:protein-tyrosine-phosphatase n=1 Tax=Galendromus occidentalis TaxID=34638 RepID=A0AAJ6QUQ5_9ACAR|nr:dual specificity protein phosphatase 8-like [Galendromus occidentalis]